MTHIPVNDLGQPDPQGLDIPARSVGDARREATQAIRREMMAEAQKSDPKAFNAYWDAFAARHSA